MGGRATPVAPARPLSVALGPVISWWLPGWICSWHLHIDFWSLPVGIGKAAPGVGVAETGRLHHSLTLVPGEDLPISCHLGPWAAPQKLHFLWGGAPSHRASPGGRVHPFAEREPGLPCPLSRILALLGSRTQEWVPLDVPGQPSRPPPSWATPPLVPHSAASESSPGLGSGRNCLSLQSDAEALPSGSPQSRRLGENNRMTRRDAGTAEPPLGVAASLETSSEGGFSQLFQEERRPGL